MIPKFRGKRYVLSASSFCIDSGEWVYGSLVTLGKRAFIVPFPGITPSIDILVLADIAEFIEVDPATVGQFTGRLDINDKEIYFGDKIRLISEIENEFKRFEGWHIGWNNIESFISLISPDESDSIPLWTFDYKAFIGVNGGTDASKNT